MIARLWTTFLLLLAGGFAVTWLVALLRERNVRPGRAATDFVKSQSKLGRVVLGAFFVGMWIYASTKPGGGGSGGTGGDGGGTNGVQMVQGIVAGGGGLTQSRRDAENGREQGFRGGSAQLSGGEGGGDSHTEDMWADFEPITSENTDRVLDADDFRRGFVMTRVGTDEAFDFVPSSDAVVNADWQAFGAAEDWFYLALEDWAFRLGTNVVDRFRVFSFGRVEPMPPATNRWFAPFLASLGVVPSANWNQMPAATTSMPSVALAEEGLPSQLSQPSQRSLFWHLVTSSNTLQLTWQNVLLNRETDAPVSFQMELWPNGRFVYRYDLSRLNAESVQNVLVGALIDGGAWTTNALPTNVTSLAFHALTLEDAVDPDKDGDGLATIDEIFVHGTDPALADTDGDGLLDPDELREGTDPWNPDSDGDGLLDGEEVAIETNPLSPDSDSDGVRDGDELYVHGTDPLLADTDGDNISDAEEIAGVTDPTKADTDGDGLDDDEEIENGTDPLNPDSDFDGAPDGWEVENGSDPLLSDTDGDGLSDGVEMQIGSSPILVDTDGDGLDDFEEFTETGTSPALADTDGDGLSDWLEVDRVSVLPSNSWVEVASGAETLFAAPTEGMLDDAIVTTNLPFLVEIGGVGFNRVSLDTNGKIHLVPTNGAPVTSFSYENADPAEMPPGGSDVVVASYWDDLVLYPHLSSLVRIGVDASNECAVVDYVGMGLYGSSDTNASVTCQIVLSNDTNYPIRVNYLSVSTNMSGESATIGVFNHARPSYRNRSRCQSLVWSYDGGDAVCSGLSLGFRPGVGTDPLNADTDGDGLNDGDEFDVGTDPWNPDTDGDGLEDGAEIAANASPFVPDTDHDGMPDVWEVRYGLAPDNPADASLDADHDGLTNLREFRIGSSPCNRDTDGDGRSDCDEDVYGTSPTLRDTDGDGLDDMDEYRRGTSGTDSDSDHDGLPDGWEVENGLDPRDSGGTFGANGDSDDDGLTNAEEYALGTHPRMKDTDGDGLDDGEEVGCFRRRYARDDEWASVSNGWTSVGIESDGDFSTYWFSFDEPLKIGDEWLYDVLCQWNGLVLVGSDTCYPYDSVWSDPSDLAGEYVSDAVLTIAPYWTESLSNSVASSVGVLKRGSEGNVSYAIQYTALPAGGTNTVSFQVVLSFTNGFHRSTEIVYGVDASGQINGFNASVGVQDAIRNAKWPVGFNEYVSMNPVRVMQFLPGTGTDPLNEVVDSDGDGLPDDLEDEIGTDPFQPDTDGDGMNDGWEYRYGFDPLVDNDDPDVDDDEENDSGYDADGDGLTNREEADWGTDPYDDDTDGDGVTDGEEVAQSSDPFDATDGGRPASRVPVAFTFGDPSGSHSEKYRLVVRPVEDPSGRKPAEGEEPRTFEWIDAEYGECETKTAMLLRGWTYEVQMYHAGTNIEGGPPDYDYRLSCSPPSCVGVVTNDPQRLFGENSNSGETFEADGKVAHVLVLDGCIVGDYDRKDGFTDYDLSRVYRNKPLRHWINDDDDEGDTNDSPGDTPGASGMPQPMPTPMIPGSSSAPASGDTSTLPSRVADWWNDHVDGKCDIIDFTPVWIDMGVALQQLERFAKSGGKYELYLSCDDGSVNVVWTSLTTNSVSDFLTTAVAGCGEELGENLEEAKTVHLTTKERKVPDALVSLMRSGREHGVFLIEGRKIKDGNIATSPIVLRCYKGPRASDAQPLFELKLPLSISPVEDMYRWKSFRAAAGEENLSFPDRTNSPANFPDNETNGKNLLFLHGANVSEQNARAWMSEMFKRFRQSGCSARFHGVTWRSNIGNGANYQEDVSNAFVTAQWLYDYASTVEGRKIFVAHSLGNVVVSSAISDWGMDAGAYFMCNAAVPTESLDPDTPVDRRLVHDDWAKYPESLYSCKWYRNFPANDARRKLTWNGRFTNILDRAYNLYSSGDHCFELYGRGNPSLLRGAVSWTYFGERYCWQKQELGKGCRGGLDQLGTTDWAGWGFEKNWKGTKKKCPVPGKDETISSDDLAQHPAFRVFPSWMNSPYLSRRRINSVLAQGIPTITPAVGNTETRGAFRLDSRRKNIDSVDFKPNGWPDRGRDWNVRWLHGDMKDVAYYFTFSLYRFIVEQGGLK